MYFNVITPCLIQIHILQHHHGGNTGPNEPIVCKCILYFNIHIFRLKRSFEVLALYLTSRVFTVFSAKILCIILAERQHISA